MFNNGNAPFYYPLQLQARVKSASNQGEWIVVVDRVDRVGKEQGKETVPI